MAFRIRTTMTFAGLEQGSSESFVWEQASDNLDQAEATITPIAQKRAKLLSKSWTLTVVRNAIIQDNAGATVKRVTDLFEPRIAGNQSWADGDPGVALMCLWQTADNKSSKKQYMRGVPAGIGDTGKKPDFSFTTFSTYFDQWREAMRLLPAGWLKSSDAQTKTITNYTQATNGNVIFTIDAGMAWPQGVGKPTRVYISLPGKSPLDGPQVVIRDPTGNSPFTKNPIGVAPFVTGQVGTMVIKGYTFVNLSGVSTQGQTGIIHPQRMVTHKTGRPSYASRGRLPARTKW